MAFGFGGGDNEIQLKVTLDAQEAEREADRVKKDIEDSFKGIASAAKNPINAISDLGKQFLQTSPKAAALAEQMGAVAIRLAPLAGIAIGVTAAVAGLTLGFNKLIDVAADGDKFGDISDAFDANAAKAGVLADVLRNDLSRAFQDTVASSTLMTEANKAFALGISPDVFDDLAAAAKRYADATGGDATQALDELITGVNSGREALLRKFGTIENGLLVLKEFTDAEYQNGQAASNVTDIYERFQARVADAYAEFAKAVNNSQALKLATEALTSVLGTLADVLSVVGVAALQLADFLANAVNDALNGVVFSVVYLSELLTDLKGGALPDFSKAFAVAAKQIAGYQKQAESAGKVTVKLGGGIKDVGKSVAKSVGDPIGEAVEELKKFEIQVNKTLGLEDFTLSPQIKVLRDQVREAFTFGGGDKQKVLEALKANVIGPYLKEVEKLPEEFKKRIGELDDAIKTVASEQTKGKTTIDASQVFGIDAGDISQELASSIEGAIGTGLNLASKAISGGVTGADAAAVGSAVGTVVGTAIGAYFNSPEAGALAGNAVGGFLGQIAAKFGEDSAGTKARKEVDKFFADLFSADRLSVIIDGELKRINDLVFNKNTGGNGGLFGAIGGAALGLVSGGAAVAGGAALGSSPSPDQTNQDFFATLPQSAQAAFNAVGLAFEQFLGVAEDYGGQLAAVFAGNIGGSLEGLQVLVQSTGRSFEELGDSIIQSFLNGNLSIQEAYDSLVQLSDLFTAGIPGQIGAIDQAFQNFDIALQDGKGSRILIDSLRDIGAEAQELGIRDFPTLANRLVQSFGFAGPQIDAFFAALKASGIESITDLVNASTASLVALARNVQLITQGQAPTAGAITDPTAGITAPGNFTSGGASRVSTSGGRTGGGVRSAAQTAQDRAAADRKRQLQQLQQETIKLVTASSAYDKIIDSLNKHLIGSKKAGDDINDLYKRQFSVLQTLQKAQDAYNKALANGTGGKKLSDLATALEKAQKSADKLNGKLEETAKVDLSALTSFIRDMNSLGVVSKAVGVNAETLVSTLTQGFLRGKLSISQVNDEIAKTKDLLGLGIPGAVGAVDDAFKNLQKGGRNGGLFSVDAFKDIFAEFDELFKKNAGPARQAQFKQLTAEFNTARDALQAGINTGKTPEEIQKLRDQFAGADKALKDFNDTIPKADFEDLRAKLKESFAPEQVDIFFRALQDSGINTFEEFKNAGTDAVVAILGDLDQLGFDFATKTDESTAKLLEEFNKANTAQTEGKDILQTQVDLIKQFLDGAGGLPSVFNETATSLQGFEGPLATLSADFDSVLTKLALFDGKTYQSDILLNVDFNAKNSQTQSLIDLLFGGGGGTSGDVGGTGPGVSTGLTTSEKQEFFALRRKKKTGKLSKADQARFDDLNSRRVS